MSTKGTTAPVVIPMMVFIAACNWGDSVARRQQPTETTAKTKPPPRVYEITEVGSTGERVLEAKVVNSFGRTGCKLFSLPKGGLFEAAGFLPGDVILMIDDSDFACATQEEVSMLSEMLRGRQFQIVKIQRRGQTIEIRP